MYGRRPAKGSSRTQHHRHWDQLSTCWIWDSSLDWATVAVSHRPRSGDQTANCKNESGAFHFTFNQLRGQLKDCRERKLPTKYSGTYLRLRGNCSEKLTDPVIQVYYNALRLLWILRRSFAKLLIGIR